MYVERSSTLAIQSYLRHTDLLVVPFGSIEAHGPHLPVGTDNYILEEVVASLDLAGLAIAPLQRFTPVNFAHETGIEKYGSINLTPRTWREFTGEYVNRFCDIGFNRLLFITWHDTQRFRDSAQQLALDLGARFVRLWPIAQKVCLSHRIPVPAGERHAAFIETSLMLHSHPDLVATNEIRRGKYLDMAVPRSLDGSGIYGDPRKANRAYGGRIYEYLIEALSEELKDLTGMELRSRKRKGTAYPRQILRATK